MGKTAQKAPPFGTGMILVYVPTVEDRKQFIDALGYLPKQGFVVEGEPGEWRLVTQAQRQAMYQKKATLKAAKWRPEMQPL